ncbi:transmembrane protein, putative (macronuclear) [Tetrahymena thermophila SB210]|uniref:Transmembrane protein, putative n=1 Tax=Tetrahymena thermophila (strain SB210) TaxID=312017 RepID=W7XJL9_TETTS|nr:transmembrane protein, putative [Tetrahymena thermophila SB210]EWS75651.1 transmembrane protein, putative [Tetrahymena thermophila SB210]|eukprot:XP_012651797.1 transmembrane protein, putative [Tetrahymena thermophila SB210]
MFVLQLALIYLYQYHSIIQILLEFQGNQLLAQLKTINQELNFDQQIVFTELILLYLSLQLMSKTTSKFDSNTQFGHIFRFLLYKFCSLTFKFSPFSVNLEHIVKAVITQHSCFQLQKANQLLLLLLILHYRSIILQFYTVISIYYCLFYQFIYFTTAQIIIILILFQ